MRDPTISTPTNTDHIALAYRRRVIEARLAVLDKMLGDDEPTSDHERNLDHERRTLRGMRGEIIAIIGPKLPRRPRRVTDPQLVRQLDLLRAEIRSRVAGTLHFVGRLEDAGEHRQARLHRAALIYVAEGICSEYSIPPALLAHCDPPELPSTTVTGGELLPSARSVL